MSMMFMMPMLPQPTTPSHCSQHERHNLGRRLLRGKDLFHIPDREVVRFGRLEDDGAA